MPQHSQSRRPLLISEAVLDSLEAYMQAAYRAVPGDAPASELGEALALAVSAAIYENLAAQNRAQDAPHAGPPQRPDGAA